MNTEKCLSDSDLGRLLDGDFDAQDIRALKQHIANCPSCSGRWQRLTDGVQYVENLLSGADKKSKATDDCLSDETITEFVNQSLEQQQKQAVESHLIRCVHCRDAMAERFSEIYQSQGHTWWRQHVGRQLSALFSLLSISEIEEITEQLTDTALPQGRSDAVIKLPLTEPVVTRSRRLAAATGEGFSEQTLRQEDPPFEFHLVQFGEQLRISCKSLKQNSPYNDCLAKIELFEVDNLRWSQVVLIERGQSRCVITPDQMDNLRPEKTNLVVKLQPVATLEQLSSVGSQAYKPILEKLLHHKEAKIRRGAVEVVARIYGTEGRQLIEPLVKDSDQTVSQAAKKALNRLPDKM